MIVPFAAGLKPALHALADPHFAASDVRRYYDTHTPGFMRHGQGGRLGAIHRAVWGPGVADRDRAFRYVEDLILRELDTFPTDHPIEVLDLGCGVGGSLTYLAQQRPLRGVGITLSPVQARAGRARIAALGLADQIEIVDGDYNALPPALTGVDLAYAIESFVHGPSPERFLEEAARVLAPGGRLVVCDDFRTDHGQTRAARTLAQFARGWHVNTLIAPEELRALAARAGLEPIRTTDLTPWLELGRPRDRAIGLLAAAVGWIPSISTRLAPLIGGAALQRGLARGGALVASH